MGTVTRSWKLEKRGDPLEEIAAQGQFSGHESWNMWMYPVLWKISVPVLALRWNARRCWLRRNSRPPSSCLPAGKVSSA